MLSVGKKPIMLSVIMLNVAMLSVVMLSVVAPYILLLVGKACQGKHSSLLNPVVSYEEYEML